MQTSQENFTTIVYAKFGGQTECITGNWKMENCYTITSLVSCSCGDATQHRVCVVVTLNQLEVANVGFSASSMPACVVQRLENFICQMNHYITIQLAFERRHISASLLAAGFFSKGH